MEEHRIVDPKDVGSSPIRSATLASVCYSRLHGREATPNIFNDPVGEWLSHEAFNLVIAGSNPVRITTHVCVLLSLGLPLFLEVAQPGQSSRLGPEMPLVRIQPSRPTLRAWRKG